MKIKHKFIGLFLLLLGFTVGVTGWLLYQETLQNAVDGEFASMHQDLSLRVTAVENFNDRAKSDLLFTLHYPAFREYFELPETKAGNVYVDGVLQFTDAQRAIKNELDGWIAFFQARFNVDETCIIDRTGQEHTRLVHGQRAPDEDFSDHEDEAGFFIPSLENEKGNVYVEYPYMSPDSERMVFAYTSPIVLDDGSKPSFFHFELPVDYFTDVITADTPEGRRILVVDAEKGLIIADTDGEIDTRLREGQNPEEVMAEDIFPDVSILSSKDTEKIDAVLADLRERKMGNMNIRIQNGAHAMHGMEDMEGMEDMTSHVAYHPLPFFGWGIIEITGHRQHINQGINAVFEDKVIITLIILLAIDLIAVIWFTEAISRPLRRLTRVANKISQGDMDVKIPVIKTKDEVHDLAEAIGGVLAAVQFLRDELNRKQ